MNPNFTSALSEFNKKSEFSKSGLAAELTTEPPLHPSELSLITRARLRLGKLIPFAFVRFLVIFFGVAATLAWQSYGATAREMMASWFTHLAWLTPPPAPASLALLPSSSSRWRVVLPLCGRTLTRLPQMSPSSRQSSGAPLTGPQRLRLRLRRRRGASPSQPPSQGAGATGSLIVGMGGSTDHESSSRIYCPATSPVLEHILWESPRWGRSQLTTCLIGLANAVGCCQHCKRDGTVKLRQALSPIMLDRGFPCCLPTIVTRLVDVHRADLLATKTPPAQPRRPPPKER